MLATCPYPAPHGTAVCIHELACALADAGHTIALVSYATAASQPPPAQCPRLTHHAVPSARVALRSGPQWRKWRANARLARYALNLGRQGCFDVLHGHHIEGMALGALLRHRLKLPLVGHLHTRLAYELPAYIRARHLHPAAQWTGRLLDRHAVSAVDALVTLNAADTAACAPYAPRGGIFTRYPKLRPANTSASVTGALEATHQAADDAPYVIYSGNADGYQNLQLLAAAMHQVPMRLVLATHGPTTAFAGHKWPVSTRMVRCESFEEMARWLLHAAMGACPRVQPCGYPIKWLNYWRGGLPLVATEPAGQSVFGGQLNTAVHGPALWAAPDVRAFAAALKQAQNLRGAPWACDKAAANPAFCDIYAAAQDAYSFKYSRRFKRIV